MQGERRTARLQYRHWGRSRPLAAPVRICCSAPSPFPIKYVGQSPGGDPWTARVGAGGNKQGMGSNKGVESCKSFQRAASHTYSELGFLKVVQALAAVVAHDSRDNCKLRASYPLVTPLLVGLVDVAGHPVPARDEPAPASSISHACSRQMQKYRRGAAPSSQEFWCQPVSRAHSATGPTPDMDTGWEQWK